MHNEQRFFALRHVPGQTLKLPFRHGTFNALVEIAAPVDREIMTSVAMQLLEHGMCAADCHGEDAGEFAAVVDELVDEYQFSHNDRTVFATSHDDVTLDEVIDYFILPNDLSDTGVLIVIGGESDFEVVIDTFNQSTDAVESEKLTLAVC